MYWSGHTVHDLCANMCAGDVREEALWDMFTCADCQYLYINQALLYEHRAGCMWKYCAT